MKKVYSTADIIMAGHVQSLLEADNIPCIVKNQSLAGGIGELPINECWPEIWVLNDEDSSEAEQIIQATLSPSEQAPWHCQCGEDIEGQFSVCWNCGREKN